MTAPAPAAGILLLDRLLAGGVTDVVLAPGSRSAPLALALAAAEREGRVRLHVRVDERSAAFLALGLAKVSGLPVAVACTSGTAVANLLPAVVEARYSGVPLVVVTADRPPELRGRGASQTIDQAGLFDRFVLGSRDLPVPGDEGWEAQYVGFVDAAVELAARSRGPVHLNTPFRAPLVAPSPVPEPQPPAPERQPPAPAPTPPVPDPVEGPAVPAPAPTSPVPEPVEGPVTPLPGPAPVPAATSAFPEVLEGNVPGSTSAVEPTPGLGAVTGPGRSLREPQGTAVGGPLVREPQGTAARAQGRGIELPARTVVVAGDLDVWDADSRAHVAQLAVYRGWPIVWEASSGLAGAPTAIPHGTLLLADGAARQRLRADAVLTVGPYGLDRGVLAFVRAAGRHVAVRLRPRTDPPDPLGTAERVVSGPLALSGAGDRDDGWLAGWRAEAAALADRIEDAPPAGPTVADVARCVWHAAVRNDLLFVASSLAIRQVAAFASGPGPHVVANRGANGIDGLVSSAWGAALSWPGRTFALLGDLAFLHDGNGLHVPDDEAQPDLTYVVADNNGGGIFATLEQGAPEYAEDFERVFGTPHHRNLVTIAQAHGISAREVPIAELPAALTESQHGTRVLVVPVAGADTEAAWLRALVP